MIKNFKIADFMFFRGPENRFADVYVLNNLTNEFETKQIALSELNLV